MAYGKEYKEEVLSRFHASGMSMRAACSSLEGFPCAATLSAFAREEGAGLLRPPALAVPGRCEGRRAWEPYPPVGLQAGAPRRARRPVPSRRRARARGSCYDVRARVVRLRDSRTDRRGQEDRAPLAGQGRRRAEARDEGEGRRGRGEGRRRRAGRMVPRMGRPPRRRPRRAGAAGRGQARGGAGGVGRPKSTRPGLFEQFGEAPGGREGEGDGGEGEGR